MIVIIANKLQSLLVSMVEIQKDPSDEERTNNQLSYPCTKNEGTIINPMLF